MAVRRGTKKSNKKKSDGTDGKMSNPFTNFLTVMLILIFSSVFYLVISFKPLTKDDQIERINKLNEEVEPFRKNMTECARQVKASQQDVEHFLKRIPQSSNQGKCLVACILKRAGIIKKNKIDVKALLDSNREVYGEDEEVMSRLTFSVEECGRVVEGIFEICEYASVFNDCMHMKMEHLLDKLTMERRMEALGQMTSNPDNWSDDDDELLKLLKDEL